MTPIVMTRLYGNKENVIAGAIIKLFKVSELQKDKMDRVLKVVNFILAIMILLISNSLKVQQVWYEGAPLSPDCKPGSITV